MSSELLISTLNATLKQQEKPEAWRD
ncbi:hypothetical protein AYI70_g3572, partial [Smittium culicis]